MPLSASPCPAQPAVMVPEHTPDPPLRPTASGVPIVCTALALPPPPPAPRSRQAPPLGQVVAVGGRGPLRGALAGRAGPPRGGGGGGARGGGGGEGGRSAQREVEPRRRMRAVGAARAVCDSPRGDPVGWCYLLLVLLASARGQPPTGVAEGCFCAPQPAAPRWKGRLGRRGRDQVWAAHRVCVVRAGCTGTPPIQRYVRGSFFL